MAKRDPAALARAARARRVCMNDLRMLKEAAPLVAAFQHKFGLMTAEQVASGRVRALEIIIAAEERILVAEERPKEQSSIGGKNSGAVRYAAMMEEYGNEALRLASLR